MKRLTKTLMMIVVAVATFSAVNAQTFSVCIVDNYNEVWSVTNTKIGGGVWSCSGTFQLFPGSGEIYTVVGSANGQAKTFHWNAIKSQDECTLYYDSLVWNAERAPGDFQGFLDQYCGALENAGSNIVLVSCKCTQGLCDNVSGCGLVKQMESPAMKSFNPETMTQVADNVNSIDTYFDLLAKYDPSVGIAPNPANNNTTFSYNVAKAGVVTVSVYNFIGQLVNVVVNESQAAGDYTYNWNLTDSKGSSVHRGNYFVMVNSNGSTQTQAFSVEK